MEQVHLDLGLAGTHVIVTGGAGMIGSAVVSAFLSAGSKVSVLDINIAALDGLRANIETHQYPPGAGISTHEVDISSEESIDLAFSAAQAHFGPIATCVALASLDLSVLPHRTSIVDLSFAQWRRTFDVNVHGTFLTAQAWLSRLDRLRRNSTSPGSELSLRNVGLIIIGSESGIFGVPGNADYAAGKSTVQGGLLQSLKAELPRIWPNARVNAVAPGPVETPLFRRECAEDAGQYYMDAQATVALGRPVSMSSIARGIVFLASEAWSGDVHGQILAIDGGKSGRLMWHEDEAARLPKTF